MKLSNLLATRQLLLRQSYLANLAYCFRSFENLARRIHRARLHGPVRLSQEDPSEERYWPVMASLDGRQSVIEEHFDDDDILLLVDGISFALERSFTELEFDLSEMEGRFVRPLRQALIEAGVDVDTETGDDAAGGETRDVNRGTGRE